jgi:hypothetical protein
MIQKPVLRTWSPACQTTKHILGQVAFFLNAQMGLNSAHIISVIIIIVYYKHFYELTNKMSIDMTEKILSKSGEKSQFSSCHIK